MYPFVCSLSTRFRKVSASASLTLSSGLIANVTWNVNTVRTTFDASTIDFQVFPIVPVLLFVHKLYPAAQSQIPQRPLFRENVWSRSLVFLMRRTTLFVPTNTVCYSRFTVPHPRHRILCLLRLPNVCSHSLSAPSIPLLDFGHWHTFINSITAHVSHFIVFPRRDLCASYVQYKTQQSEPHLASSSRRRSLSWLSLLSSCVLTHTGVPRCFLIPSISCDGPLTPRIHVLAPGTV